MALYFAQPAVVDHSRKLLMDEILQKLCTIVNLRMFNSQAEIIFHLQLNEFAFCAKVSLYLIVNEK